MATAILTALCCLATAANALLWLAPTRRLLREADRRGSDSACPTEPDPVSVVVAVRDEAANLPALLDALLAQDYAAGYEVVVCDDGSTDGTRALLAERAARDPRLRVVDSPDPTRPGKKLALGHAIAQARHPWLVATDGDCVPAGPRWLTRLMASRAPATEFVLGYSPYRRAPGLLNAWIRAEAWYTGVQYLSAALAGRPYMGVGRNLAYARSAYARVGGFAAHAHLPGGDDDLLVQAAATGANTRVCVHPEAWAWSEPAPTWRAYLRQKRRHVSVGAAYAKTDQAWLAALAASHVASVGGAVALVASGAWVWVWGLGLLAAREVLLYRRRARLGSALGMPELRRPGAGLALDLGLVAYYVGAAVALGRSRPREW